VGEWTAEIPRERKGRTTCVLNNGKHPYVAQLKVLNQTWEKTQTSKGCVEPEMKILLYARISRLNTKLSKMRDNAAFPVKTLSVIADEAFDRTHLGAKHKSKGNFPCRGRVKESQS